MSMLTDLKLLFLAFKCVFYRPEHNPTGWLHGIEFWGLEKQKWNIPKDRAQRVDETNQSQYGQKIPVHLKDLI